jgi:predicted YcjX-like family ATPase
MTTPTTEAGRALLARAANEWPEAFIATRVAILALDALDAAKADRDTWERTFRVAESRASDFLDQLDRAEIRADAAEAQIATLVEALTLALRDHQDGYCDTCEPGRVILSDLAAAAVAHDTRIVAEERERLTKHHSELASHICCMRGDVDSWPLTRKEADRE